MAAQEDGQRSAVGRLPPDDLKMVRQPISLDSCGASQWSTSAIFRTSCAPRRPCFIAPRFRRGFTTPSRVAPRLPGLLMHCTSERHGLRPSYSFGPSPQTGGYYGHCWLLAPALLRRPFRHKAISPQARTHSFTAQPPDLRRFALITRALRLRAHSPCSAAPPIRFLFIGSQLMFHASFPRSVALTQLRFTSFAVINLRRDSHPQECAHAGRTQQKNT